MGYGSVPHVSPARDDTLRAVHNVLSTWEQYIMSVKRSSNGGRVLLPLEAFQVDYEDSCIEYLRKNCNEKMPPGTKVENLSITFNPFESMVRNGPSDYNGFAGDGSDESDADKRPTRTPGKIGQWLATSSIPTHLAALTLKPTFRFSETHVFSDASHKSRFNAAWPKTFFPVMETMGGNGGNKGHSRISRLQQLTIHDIFDLSSSMDPQLEEQFSLSIKNVLIAAGRPCPPLKPASTFISLILTELVFTDRLVQEIAHGLQQGGGSQLQNLILNRTGLTTKMVDTLLSGLFVNYTESRPTLREVGLARNKLTATSLSTCLTKLMELAPGLGSLDLSHNGHFFSATLASLESDDYETLDGLEGTLLMSNNQNGYEEEERNRRQEAWEHEHIMAFARALEKHSCIHSIYLLYVYPRASTTIPLLVCRFFQAANRSLANLHLTAVLISRSFRLPYMMPYETFCLHQTLLGSESVKSVVGALDGLALMPTYDDDDAQQQEPFAFQLYQVCTDRNDNDGRRRIARSLSAFFRAHGPGGKVKGVSARNCRLDEFTIPALVGGLRETAGSVHDLVLEECHFTDEVARTLLCQTGFVVVGGQDQDLASAPRACRLRELSFRQNELGPESLPLLTETLVQHERLEILDLALNFRLFEADTEAMESFFRAVQRAGTLRELGASWGHSEQKASQASRLLFGALEINASVQKLDMLESLSLPTDTEWTQSLGKVKGLRHLVLPHTFLDDVNWEVFMAGVRQNTSLVKCDVYRSCSPVRPVAHVLTRNRLLERVMNLGRDVKGEDNSNKGSNKAVPRCALPQLIHRLGSNEADGSPVFSFFKLHVGLLPC